MASKLFTGGVIAFWVIMMTALVRVEFFPRESRLLPVSTDRVLQKVLTNPDPTRLRITYQGNNLGLLRLDSEPAEFPTTGYHLDANLWLSPSLLDLPGRIHLRTRADLDANLGVHDYDATLSIGDNKINFTGNAAAQTLKLKYRNDLGDQERDVDYRNLSAATINEILGSLGLGALPAIPGFENLGFLTGKRNSPGAAASALGRPVTKAYLDYIPISGLDQRVFVIETKFSEGFNLWMKLFVDEQGHPLKLETPFGLRLVSTDLDQLESPTAADRGAERQHNRKP